MINGQLEKPNSCESGTQGLNVQLNIPFLFDKRKDMNSYETFLKLT